MAQGTQGHEVVNGTTSRSYRWRKSHVTKLSRHKAMKWAMTQSTRSHEVTNDNAQKSRSYRCHNAQKSRSYRCHNAQKSRSYQWHKAHKVTSPPYVCFLQKSRPRRV